MGSEISVFLVLMPSVSVCEAEEVEFRTWYSDT